MVRHTMTAGVVGLLLAFSGAALADAVNVNGIVEDDQGNPIEGATVTVSLGNTGNNTVTGTTDAAGVYDLNTQSGGGMGGNTILTVTAAAAGFLTGTHTQVLGGINDGTPDTATVNFTLTPGQQPTGDSLYVNGTVDDGTDPIEGATVTVTLGTVLTGIQTATATTAADGTYEIAIINQNMATQVVIEAAAVGYVTQQATVQIANPNDGTADVLTRNFSLDAAPVGDSLYVSGTIDDGADPIEGATVTVTIGGTQTATATTAADGSYEVAMLNQDIGTEVVVEVSAAGYLSQSTTSTLAAPDDGTADRLTRNFSLDLIVYQTLTVTGSVVDDASSPISGARVIVSYVDDGLGGQMITDTVLSGADGTFELLAEVVTMPADIDWMIEADGYTSDNGTQAVANDVAEIGEVILAAYSTNDPVSYTVSGKVTDETGAAVRNVDVIVELMFGAELIMRETVRTNMQGNYTATSADWPYQEGTIDGSVHIEVVGYITVDEVISVASSTTDIVVNVQLTPETTVIARRAAVNNGVTCDRIDIYAVDGRLLGTLRKAPMNTATIRALNVRFGVQPYVVRMHTAEGLSTAKIMPVR